MKVWEGGIFVAEAFTVPVADNGDGEEEHDEAEEEELEDGVVPEFEVCVDDNHK